MSSSVLLTKANTSFCLDLLKKLSEEDKSTNIFFSPFSISAAMAMVMMGARGNTAAQLSETLGFTEAMERVSADVPLMSSDPSGRNVRTQQISRLPNYLLKVFSCCPQCLKAQDEDQDDVHAKFSELLSDYDKEPALILSNRLYGEQSYVFDETFLVKTQKHYKAELETVDFRNNAEDSRLNINMWVEKQTKGHIVDLLSESVLDSRTTLVLVNAIYFKGKWKMQFNTEDTTEEEFRINKNETKPVKMMHIKSKFHTNSIPELNCEILEMPYEGEDLTMIIILPNDIEDDTTGLEKLEKELTFDRFMEWTRPDMMGWNTAHVKLPRFNMEETYDMKDVLSSLGIVDAFDVSRSNFSGMSRANDLVLSKVLHKAVVEVNEEGSEAAAASAAVINDRAVIVPTMFTADHPFLFFIQHKPTQMLLFAGRCCSPQ
ncbi:leukocyte elastase inhibitor A-like [Gouania willdenowi]|uniref:Serpin B6 n=1 Tax=Gouania willdenowi TaxID=441366 RepID=A0A8C5HA42_GOUWI|nr:leukocyte elastase inhibitor A-like [Gouania willdenowi]